MTILRQQWQGGRLTEIVKLGYLSYFSAQGAHYKMCVQHTNTLGMPYINNNYSSKERKLHLQTPNHTHTMAPEDCCVTKKQKSCNYTAPWEGWEDWREGKSK